MPIKILKLIFWSIVGFMLFAHLNTLPVMIFDEGRLAVSAYEMFKHGNYFVPHYDGGPDMWSLKPPLMIWAQVLMIKIIGYDILAIRLPAAFAGLVTVLLLFWFLKKHCKSEWLPYLAVGVLMTTPGYVMIHGTRSGDYDAFLVLFNTFYCFQFYNYIKFGKNRSLFLVFIGITLAVMTKGVAGFIFCPFLLAFAIKEKQVVKILKTPAFYLGFVLLLGTVVSYYLYRESINPGYLAAVYKEELGGRFSGSIQEDRQPWYYYLRLMYHNHYSLWIPFTILSVVTFSSWKKWFANPHLFIFSLFAAIYYMVIISISGTKMEWYEMPIYPFLAINLAMFLKILYRKLLELEVDLPKLRQGIVPSVTLALIFGYAFLLILPNVFLPKLPGFLVEPYQISYFLRDQYSNLDDPEKYKVVHDGYYSHILFYKYFYHEQGIALESTAKENLKAGDYIILDEHDVLEFVSENYDADEIGSFHNVKVIHILGQKQL